MNSDGVQTPKSVKKSMARYNHLHANSSQKISKDHTPILTKLPTMNDGFKRSGSGRSGMFGEDGENRSSGSQKNSSKERGSNTIRKSKSGSIKISKKGSYRLREGRSINGEDFNESSDTDDHGQGEFADLANLEGDLLEKAEEKLLQDLQKHIDSNLEKEMNKDIRARLMQMRKLTRSNSKLVGKMASSIMIRQLMNEAKDNSPILRHLGPTISKKQKNFLSPAEILIRILRKATDIEKDRSTTNETKSPGHADKEIVNFKTFEFGSGKVKEYKHDTFYDALEAFENIYENVIKYDLEVNSKNRKFDFLSLMKVIKDYLAKIIKKLGTYGTKEMSAIDEIISRTEKGYFAGRLKKQFLSDKEKYKEMNVFKRLNDIEVVSISRLFKQIKYMLLNNKMRYHSKPSSQAKYSYLSMPPEVYIDADIETARSLAMGAWEETADEAPAERFTGQSLRETLEGAARNAEKWMPHQREISMTAKVFDIMNDKAVRNLRRERQVKQTVDEGNDFIDKIIKNSLFRALKKFIKVTPLYFNHENQTPQQETSESQPQRNFFRASQAPIKNYEIMLIKKGSDNKEDWLESRQEPVYKRKDLVFEVLDYKNKRDRRVHKSHVSLSHRPKKLILEDTKSSNYKASVGQQSIPLTSRDQKDSLSKSPPVKNTQHNTNQLPSVQRNSAFLTNVPASQSNTKVKPVVMSRFARTTLQAHKSSQVNDAAPGIQKSSQMNFCMTGNRVTKDQYNLFSQGLSKRGHASLGKTKSKTKSAHSTEYEEMQAMSKQFLDSNMVLIGKLLSHLRDSLSKDCLQKIAEHNLEAASAELSKKIEETVLKYTEELVALGRDRVKEENGMLVSEADVANTAGHKGVIGKHRHIKPNQIRISMEKIREFKKDYLAELPRQEPSAQKESLKPVQKAFQITTTSKPVDKTRRTVSDFSSYAAQAKRLIAVAKQDV